MDSLDHDVLLTAQRWLHAGHSVLLATVTRTWGSSPRPPGALLALRDDGRVCGSVSGGCIEDDLIERVQREGLPTQPQIVSYGASADQARRFGLPCGGTLELVLEPLKHIDALDELLSRLHDGEVVCRRLHLPSAAITLETADKHPLSTFDGQTLISQFGPRYRLLLIGAGQLSAALARIAQSLDFAVSVCDPREEHVAEWNVANTQLLRSMPDDAVRDWQPDPRSAVVVLTHDPRLDDLALLEALKSPAFYIAALGSRSNNQARRERLALFDLTAAQIARLYGPAGLFIGSRAPAEIALSIAAQLVAVKNGLGRDTLIDTGTGKTLLGIADNPLTSCTLN